MISIARRAAAELVGTGLFVTALIGSGILAERLAGGNVGLALLANALATGGVLIAAITALAPISGAHLNPVVSFVQARCGELTWRELAAYVIAQIVGAIAGTCWAHLMFDLPILQISVHEQSSLGQWIGEMTATFGLVMLVEAGRRHFTAALPGVAAAYLAAAYLFTSSTSLANPALTLARAFTDSFAGTGINNVVPFVIAQAIGGAAAAVFSRWLFRPIAT